MTQKFIIFIFVIVVFIGITYMIAQIFSKTCTIGYSYNKTYKKCIPDCSNGQQYDDSIKNCACPTGTKLQNDKCVTDCGTLKTCGEGCFNPDTQTCSKKGKACDKNKSYGIGECCDDGQEYDSVTKKCVSCKNEMCDGNCCNPDEKCTKNKKGKNICCKKENMHGDFCCTNFASVDGCCDDDQQISNDGKYCTDKCGTQFCDDDNQYCGNFNTYDEGKENSVSYCVNRTSCKFDEINYTPSHTISDKNKQIITCAKQLPLDVTQPLATCKIADIASYQALATSEMHGDCIIGDCVNRLKETGIKNVTMGTPTDPHICQAQLSCSHILPDCDGKCPIDNNDQCCFNEDGSYNGTICPDYMTCENNTCSYGYKITKSLDNQWMCNERTQAEAETDDPKKMSLTQCKQLINTQNPNKSLGICNFPGDSHEWEISDGKCYIKQPKITAQTPDDEKWYCSGMGEDDWSTIGSEHAACALSDTIPYGAYWCSGPWTRQEPTKMVNPANNTQALPGMCWTKCTKTQGCDLSGDCEQRYYFDTPNDSSDYGYNEELHSDRFRAWCLPFPQNNPNSKNQCLYHNLDATCLGS